MAQQKKIDPEKLAMVKELLAGQQASLRDQFAIAALTSGIYKGSGYEEHAMHCYALADAMLKERESNDEEE